MTELEQQIRTALAVKTNKIIPENIKKDVEIFGVVGTHEGGGGGDYYNTCDNLASLILGDSPIINDPYVAVFNTMEVSNVTQMSISNNSLIINTSNQGG